MCCEVSKVGSYSGKDSSDLLCLVKVICSVYASNTTTNSKILVDHYCYGSYQDLYINVQSKLGNISSVRGKHREKHVVVCV